MEILFGAKNPVATSKQSVKHLGVKKFVPVYDRTKQEEIYKYPTGMNFERITVEVPRYVRGKYNFWVMGKTSKPKTLRAIARARLNRVGQLKLF